VKDGTTTLAVRIPNSILVGVQEGLYRRHRCLQLDGSLQRACFTVMRKGSGFLWMGEKATFYRVPVDLVRVQQLQEIDAIIFCDK
jgi:hypothetical protein